MPISFAEFLRQNNPVSSQSARRRRKFVGNALLLHEEVLSRGTHLSVTSEWKKYNFLLVRVHFAVFPRMRFAVLFQKVAFERLHTDGLHVMSCECDHRCVRQHARNKHVLELRVNETPAALVAGDTQQRETMSRKQLRGTQRGGLARLAETLVAFVGVEEDRVEEWVVADGEMEIIITPYDLSVKETIYRNRTCVCSSNGKRENTLPHVGVEETDLISLLRGGERVPVEKSHPLGVVGERATAIQVKYARKLKSICRNAAFSPTHPDCGSTIHTCSSCSLRVTEYSGCLAPSEQRQSYRTDLEALCSKKGRSQRTPKQNPFHERTYLNRIVSADDTEDPRRIRRPFRIVDAIGAE